jgi:hypothetical protein
MIQIQFKRALSYNKDLESAIDAIKNYGLAEGEPLICSYDDNGRSRLILAIGVSDHNVRIIPAFDDYKEINDFINNNNVVINLKDQISEDSDISVDESESDGKLIFKIKDNLKNN